MGSRRTRDGSIGPTTPSPDQQRAVDDAFRNIVAIVEAARTAGGTRSRPSPKQSRPHQNNGATKKIPDLPAVIGEATSEDSELEALAASLNGMLQLRTTSRLSDRPLPRRRIHGAIVAQGEHPWACDAASNDRATTRRPAPP